jgi:hypothetical protein
MRITHLVSVRTQISEIFLKQSLNPEYRRPSHGGKIFKRPRQFLALVQVAERFDEIKGIA